MPALLHRREVGPTYWHRERPASPFQIAVSKITVSIFNLSPGVQAPLTYLVLAERYALAVRQLRRCERPAPLTPEGNLVNDFAQSGGYDDVRSLHGPPLVAVVRPSDVRDQAALLDAEE